MQAHVENGVNIHSQGPEGIEQVPINILFMLIHPLDATPGLDILDTPHTRRVRGSFYMRAQELFLPRDQNDVLIVVPRVGTDQGDFMRKRRTTMESEMLYPELRSWITLQEEFKRRIHSKKNIFLGENIALAHVPSSKIEERISKRGFSITPDTTIILGGEYAENCLLNAAIDILALPQVSSILIDKRLLLGRDNYPKHGKLKDSSKGILCGVLRALGHNVNERKTYIHVSNL